MDINPVYEKGRVINFDNYEKLMSGLMRQEMNVDPSHFSLLLSEDNVHDRRDRQKIAEFVFEKLEIKNLFFCKTAVLSSFCTGRSTSVVLDCGADMSSAVTVHDGFALSKTLRRVDIGGEFLTGEMGRYIETELGNSVVPRVGLGDVEGLTPSYLRYHRNALLRDIK